MTRSRRLAQGGLIALLLIVAALAFVAWYLLLRPLAKTSGTLDVPGLLSQVEVRRDSWGIPHIYAQNEADLYLAQGYVHAQDRLWQMDFQRRIGQGRLSEVLGESTLDTDRFLRTIGTNRAALADYANLQPETRANLERYAAGVNAYIESHRENLPLEFTLLGYAPEPWRPEDSLVWGKMLQWDLNGTWRGDLLRANLVAKVGETSAAQLLAPYPEAGPFTLPEEVEGYRHLGEPDLATVEQTLAVAGLALDGTNMGLGSNNWVIGPRKSATGRPMLANDPHLGIRMPSIWYLVGLHTPELNLSGATFPGVPGVIIGHNDHIAWGVTNLGADVQDLYLERLNPNNPNEYEVAGRYEPFQIVRESITVKGNPNPILMDVRISRHGPIINDVVTGLDQPTAFRWIATSQPSTLVQAVFQLNRATDWESFTTALESWDQPMQNFVYADVEGNIGYYGAGRVPIRGKGTGNLPVPGWSYDYDWVDVIPFDQLPHAFNPPEGFIATANNRPVDYDYPFSIGEDYAAPNRQARIVSRLEEPGRLTMEEMIAIQGDVESLPARALVPLLVEVPSDNIIVQRAQEQLRAWHEEGHNRLDSNLPGAGIFQATYRQIVKALVEDELGADLSTQYLGLGSAHNVMLPDMVTRPDDAWWDDTRTEARESRDDILRRALEAMALELGRQYGDVPHEWNWGRMHVANFEHPIGVSWPLTAIFNRSAGGVGGDGQTPFATGYRYAGSFEVASVPSYRQMIDVGEWDNSRFSHTTGQSGQPFSPHYDDMIPHWKSVRLLPMRFSREAVDRAAPSVLILQPGVER